MDFLLQINKRIVHLLLLLPLFEGCSIKGVNTFPPDKTFITGECLRSSNLKFVRAHPSSELEVIPNFEGRYHFEFAPYLETDIRSVVRADIFKNALLGLMIT